MAIQKVSHSGLNGHSCFTNGHNVVAVSFEMAANHVALHIADKMWVDF